MRKLHDSDYGDYSQIFRFAIQDSQLLLDDNKLQLEGDLGQSYLRAKYSKEIKELELKYLSETEKLVEENKSLADIVKESSKPLLVVEDEYEELYKVAWLKLNEKEFNKKSLDTVFKQASPFSICNTMGASGLAGFLRAPSVSPLKSKKVIGLFDFDETGRNQFLCIKNNTCWKKDISGDLLTGYYKKRSDHPCFYALILPVPQRLHQLANINFPSYVELENLLPESFLVANDLCTRNVTTGHTTFLKIKDEKKSDVWQKCAGLDKAMFEDFKQLFDTVQLLFAT